MALIHINRNVAKCLYRIGMEQNSVFIRNLANFLNRLNCANLIIGKHH